MQKLVQTLAAAILIFCLFAAAYADDTAAAPNLLKLKSSPETIQLVKAYTSYAQAVRDHGVEGLKPFVTPDFALEGDGPPLTGQAAFKELDACFVGLDKNHFAASVHPLTVTRTDAVALTQQTYSFQNQTAKWTATYCWKQTWRKTAQGWKLSSMEPYRGDFGRVEGVTFTVLPKASSEPAGAQEKQNVVK